MNFGISLHLSDGKYWSLSHYDVADTDVVVMDQPSLLIGIGIAAAGQGSDFW